MDRVVGLQRAADYDRCCAADWNNASHRYYGITAPRPYLPFLPSRYALGRTNITRKPFLATTKSRSRSRELIAKTPSATNVSRPIHRGHSYLRCANTIFDQP